METVDITDTQDAWVVHENPAWGERANFIIDARIDVSDVPTRLKWEQLWARQLAENRFQICCIPFFLYDLALGDEVETGLEGEDRYVFKRVVKQSGHHTFRAWFHHSTARAKVEEELQHIGCLMETRWSGSELLAIDAASESVARRVANLLYKREQLHQLGYETGRT